MEDVQLCEVRAVVTLYACPRLQVGKLMCAERPCQRLHPWISMRRQFWPACGRSVRPPNHAPVLLPLQVANTAAKPLSEVTAAATAAAGVPAPLQQASTAGGAAAGKGIPSVVLSSSDLEWGVEDSAGGVDKVPELYSRCRLPDDDNSLRMPGTPRSMGVSSTTFTSYALAGEGGSLMRGTTVASGTAAGAAAGAADGAACTVGSAMGSAAQRPVLSRFKDEELNCPICERACPLPG